MASYISLFAMVILTSAGHIMLKKFSVTFRSGKGVFPLLRNMVNPFFITGFALFACAPLFYFYALEKIEISAAFSFTALNHLIIPVSGFFLFGEKAGAKKWAGIILVSFGTALWNI